jgi:hypothetical protein
MTSASKAIDSLTSSSSSKIRSRGFILDCEKELLEESSSKILMSSALKSGVIESELKSMLSIAIGHHSLLNCCLNWASMKGSKQGDEWAK